MANSDDQNLNQLIEAVSQLGASMSQLAQVNATNNGKIKSLTTALNVVVTEFVQPTAKQAYENQRVIAQLIERGERYQEWLDEDRHDINTLRQETSSQIQSLIEEARADRQAANDRFQEFTQRFNVMQSEIRQNQRLILEQGERLNKQEQRNETLLAEVLSLSRRVQVVEDAA